MTYQNMKQLTITIVVLMLGCFLLGLTGCDSHEDGIKDYYLNSRTRCEEVCKPYKAFAFIGRPPAYSPNGDCLCSLVLQ